MSDVAPAMTAVIREEFETASPEPFRAVVFVPISLLAGFYGRFLADTQGLPSVSILHNRIKPTINKSARTGISKIFGEAHSIIYVTTDRWARDMNFPNITHVFQVGIPKTKKDYLDRLRHFERAGTKGRGVLILSEPEKGILYRLDKIQEYPRQLQYSNNDTTDSSSPHQQSLTYRVWITYHMRYLEALKWSTTELVQQANAFALHRLGFAETPAVRPDYVKDMGLEGVPGLKVLSDVA